MKVDKERLSGPTLLWFIGAIVVGGFFTYYAAHFDAWYYATQASPVNYQILEKNKLAQNGIASEPADSRTRSSLAAVCERLHAGVR